MRFLLSVALLFAGAVIAEPCTGEAAITLNNCLDDAYNSVRLPPPKKVH